MFNRDKVTSDYEVSNVNCDRRFFNGIPTERNFNPISWHTTIPELKMLHGIISQQNQVYSSENSNYEYNQSFNEDSTTSDSIPEITSKSQLKLKSGKFFRSKLTIKKIKALLTNKTLNNLPFDVHQHLVSLLPDCDKVFTNEGSENTHVTLSSSAMDNEFFNKALNRFLWKLTNGNCLLSTESLIKRIKTGLPKKSIKMNANSILSECQEKSKTMEIQSPDSTIIKFDYDISDAKVNYNFETESPILIGNKESDILLDVKKEKEISIKSYNFDQSFQFNIRNGTNTINICKKSLFDSSPKVCDATLSDHIAKPKLSPNDDSIIVPRNGKCKRRNSESCIAPTQHKRPTRSTAGQLPARLKSSSPQPGSQNTIISELLNRSQSPKINKHIPGRKKGKEKRKYKSAEFNRQSNVIADLKPVSLHNDTILLNLRTKLSERIQNNALKCYSEQYLKSETIPDFSFDVNSKSHRSLSPECDKIPFVNSPLSKSDQNHLRHLKCKNPYLENQIPTSPQWSFSSEFTSQSSVESVLSQKNIRNDLEDVSAPENLLEDLDSEEMPPPRRTLTVAAMREKMRAKKMAKEEKRKDFDKDFSFEIDKNDESNSCDMNCKHESHDSDISSIMGMAHDNEDDNMANEFDSFLIDDYHDVDIDDKILNYSDDLDDLLLSGGNDSLLEIIMKDTDAMEIANDNFSVLNSDCQHHSMVVSPQQSKYSFVNTINQSHSSVFNTSNPDISIPTLSINGQSSNIPVSISDRMDNSILSQALTSVIDNADVSKSNGKDSSGSSTIKSAIQNAYLVDGNGLSDALKLIQSLNPGAKVTTQQFFLVNSGPQLVLSQAPPTRACSTRPVNSQSPICSVTNTTQIVTQTIPSTAGSVATRCEIKKTSQMSVAPMTNTLILTNSKPTQTYNQPPILSSALSVLPNLSAFNSKPSNMYALNSDFANKLVNSSVTSLGTKFPGIYTQHQQSAMISTTTTTCTQQSTLFGTQKNIISNQNPQNAIGIRLQLAPNFQNGQHLNIIQSSPSQMIPTLMNQPLQFITPQHNSNQNTINNGNISLISQPQQMSKLVLLYPNLNCSQLSSDLINSQKSDSQQVILLSQSPKDQPTPISLSTGPTFQVVNGSNLWQSINPNLTSLLGSANGGNNLVVMNPQALSNQSFSFNYQHTSPLINTGSNIFMMSTAQGLRTAQLNGTSQNIQQYSPQKQMTHSQTSSLSIKVNKNLDEQHTNLNSNGSQYSCVEQLSNSSSSANSKLSSCDDKSSCKLSKSQSDILTDSDQEKSINSPQFQMFNGGDYSNQHNHQCHSNQHPITNGIESYYPLATLRPSLTTTTATTTTNNIRSGHLTVDIDSPSPSNSLGNNIKISTKSISSPIDDRPSTTMHSPDTDYDQSDFEIPCLYSQKIEPSNHSNNNGNYLSE